MNKRGVREEILNFDNRGSLGGDESEGQSSGEKPQDITKTLFVIGLILLIPIVGVSLWAYAGTEQGQIAYGSAGELVDEYNPINWYLDLISEQKTLDIWDTRTNSSSMNKGIDLTALQVIGSSTFRQGQDFTIAYDIDYYGIDQYGVDYVSFFCELSEGDEIVAYGAINPTDTFTLKKNDFVNCEINGADTENLEDKSYSVRGWFEFPYSTEGVILPVYFTTGEVYDPLIEEDVDFFKNYGIDEKFPIRATYNGEPLRIALGVSVSGNEEQPVVVGSSRTSSTIIGIHLENEWDGEVVDLTDMYVYLPKGVEIDPEEDSYPNIACPFVFVGSTGKQNVYQLDEGTKYEMFDPLLEANIPVFGNVKYTANERNFQCYLKINEEFVTGVYQKKEYEVEVDYIYRVNDKEAQVYIQDLSNLNQDDEETP